MTPKRTLPKILSRSDVQKLLNVPDAETQIGVRNRAIMQTMYRAGLRVSEVCNLTLADLDLENGWFYIQLAKGKKDRYIPIDVRLVPFLQAWLKFRPTGTDWLFPTLKNTQLAIRYVRDLVYRASVKAEVYLQNGRQKTKVHPHTFRHCCLTELLEDGFNISDVQAIAGHSSLATTQVYLSVRPEALAKKMRRRGEAAAR